VVRVGFRDTATDRRGGQRWAAYYLAATQVPAAHSHGDRQARARPGRTALGVSDGEGMRVARPRRGAPGWILTVREGFSG
jgi:hypothetical protein